MLSVMQFDGEDLVQGRLTKPRKLVKIQEIFPPRLRTTRTRAATRNATVERRDVGKWMRYETEQRRKIDDNGGDASISRRHSRPVGLGGTYGLDRAHVDAAHLG